MFFPLKLANSKKKRFSSNFGLLLIVGRFSFFEPFSVEKLDSLVIWGGVLFFWNSTLSYCCLFEKSLMQF
jgi:hypothetical protein